MISKQDLKKKFDTGFIEEKKAYKKQLIYSSVYLSATILVIGIAILLCILYMNKTYIWSLAIFAPIAFLFITIFPIFSFKNKFQIAFKHTFLPKLIGIIFENEEFQYEPTGRIPKPLIAQSMLIPAHDFTNGEDFLSVKMISDDKVGFLYFKICDLFCRKLIKKDGSSIKKLVFSGTFSCTKFDNIFPFELFVNTNPNNLDRIKIKNASDYAIYCNNPQKAEALFTSEFVNCLDGFESKSRKSLKFALKDDSIFFTVSYNFLNISQSAERFTFKNVERIYDDIFSVHKFINEIRNNREIFTI